MDKDANETQQEAEPIREWPRNPILRFKPRTMVEALAGGPKVTPPQPKPQR